MIEAGSSVVLAGRHSTVPPGTPGYVLQRTPDGAQVRFDMPDRSVMAVVPDAELRPAAAMVAASNPASPLAIGLLTVGGLAVVGLVGWGLYTALKPEDEPVKPAGPLVPPPPPPEPPTFGDEPADDEGFLGDEAPPEPEEDAPPGPLTPAQKRQAAWNRYGFQLERAALNAASRIGRRFKGLEGSLPVPKDPRLRTMLVAMSPGIGGGSGGSGGSGGGGGSLGLQNPTMPTGPDVWSEDEALAASALAWNSVMPPEWQAPWGRVVFNKIPDVTETSISIPSILGWVQPQLTAGQGSGTLAVNLFGRLVAETMDNLGAADQERQAPSGDIYTWDWRGRYGA